VKHIPFESVVTSNDSILHRAPSKKSFFNQKSIFRNKYILASNSVMAGWSKNKARSVPTTPEQHQDVDLHEDGDEAGEEDHQDEQVSTVSLQKEVKDLSAKLNRVLGEVQKLTKQTSVPGILQEAACFPGAQSAPVSVRETRTERDDAGNTFKVAQA
jgi:hypothetical protein